MLILVTGGSGSGKSAFAEQKAVSLAAGGELVYLATMQVYGEEGKRRWSATDSCGAAKALKP